MRYTVDFDDGDDDRWPTWVVLEWVADGVANVVERCYTKTEAESFARAYSLIKVFAE